MSIIANVIKIKLDEIISSTVRLKAEQEVIKTIDLACNICTCRNQNEFVQQFRSQIADFFGFEGAAILFRDVKTNDLFTINELEYDQYDEKSETFKKFSKHQKITFPVETGITGKVF